MDCIPNSPNEATLCFKNPPSPRKTSGQRCAGAHPLLADGVEPWCGAYRERTRGPRGSGRPGVWGFRGFRRLRFGVLSGLAFRIYCLGFRV